MAMTSDLAVTSPAIPPSLLEPVAEPVDDAPPASLEPPVPSLPPGVTLPSIDLLASDPTAFLAQLNLVLRDSSTREAHQQAEIGNEQAEQAEVERRENLERAERAARRGRRLLRRCPRFLKRLIKAIITAVSAVAAVFSGGAGAVLLVGMLLALVADPLAKALQKMGILDEKAAMWLATGLKLVGAALSLGGGAAGGTQAIAEIVTQAVRRAIDAVQVAMTAIDVQYGARSAATTYIAANATLAAEEAGTRITEGQEWIDGAAEALREASARFERVLARLGESADGLHQARLATARSFA